MQSTLPELILEFICKNLAVYPKLIYSYHVFLSVISIILMHKDVSVKVCIDVLLP